MENEIRYYLKAVKGSLKPHEDTYSDELRPAFAPKYLVTAVTLPSGAVELTVNDSEIESKIDYILEAYDDEMRLKSNPEVFMNNIMIV